MKDTLRQYPGATHWHFKRGKQTGTLELTVWPEKQRVWFDVHKNRNAPWIEETLPRLKSSIEDALAK